VIFVTIGTSEPFDRLLRALPDDGAEELVVQCGDSELRPPGATVHSYLSFEETVALVRRARVIVCHAGVGTILTALQNGRRPIVMPRRAAEGEAVDDHQVALAARLDAAGVVVLADDPATLRASIAASDASAGDPPRPARALVSELSSFVAEAVELRRRSA
jgi:UDP-N-acetylglucosamine transferase subunit ALG13